MIQNATCGFKNDDDDGSNDIHNNNDKNQENVATLFDISDIDNDDITHHLSKSENEFSRILRVSKFYFFFKSKYVLVLEWY